MGVPHPETVGPVAQARASRSARSATRTKLEAHLILDQSDIDLDRGSTAAAWIKIYGDSETTCTSKVGEIAKRNRDEIPPELSNLAGGEIATKPDPKTGAVKPLTAVYEVIIPSTTPTSSSSPASAASPRSTAAPTPSAGGSGG